MKILKSLTRKTAWVTGAFMLLWLLGVSSGTLHADEVAYIDTHNHPPFTPTCEYDNAYDDEVTTVVLPNMKKHHIQKTLFMPPPHMPGEGPGEVPCLYQHLAGLAKRYPDRFAILRGGESLNPMIQDVVLDQATLQETRPQFVKAANEIYRAGAVGFGEMAAQHFSLSGENHPYESAPPDHPLFLLLADLAAGHDVPIDLHMEAGPESQCAPNETSPDGRCLIPLPNALRDQDGNPIFNNPEFFPANIAALERLLSHNRNARIVWAHAGMDRTGYRTVDLMRGLLQKYPNLYLSIKLWDRHENHPLDENKRIKSEWLNLIKDFPDRFTMGLDSFYPPRELAQDFQLPLDFLSQLPGDLARKVAYKNAIRIYNLNRRMICHKPGTPAAATMWVDVNALNGHLGHRDSIGPCG